MRFYVQFRENSSLHDKLMVFDHKSRNIVFETVTKQYGEFVHRILNQKEACELIPDIIEDESNFVEFGEPCFDLDEQACKDKPDYSWLKSSFKYDPMRDFVQSVLYAKGTESQAVYPDEYGICGIPQGTVTTPTKPVNGNFNRTVYNRPPNYSKRINEYEIHDDWFTLTATPSANAGTTEPRYDLHIVNNPLNPRKIRDIRITIRAYGVETNGTVEDLSPYTMEIAGNNWKNGNGGTEDNPNGWAVGHSILSDLMPFVYDPALNTVDEPVGRKNSNFSEDYREFHSVNILPITRMSYRNPYWTNIYPGHWKMSFVHVAVLYGSYDKWIVHSKPIEIKTSSTTPENEAAIRGHSSFITKPDFWVEHKLSSKNEYTVGQGVNLVMATPEKPMYFTFGKRFTEEFGKGNSRIIPYISEADPLINSSVRIANNTFAQLTEDNWANYMMRRVFVEQGLFSKVTVDYKILHKINEGIKGQIKIKLVTVALGLIADETEVPLIEENMEKFATKHITMNVHPEVDEIRFVVECVEPLRRTDGRMMDAQSWRDAITDLKIIGIV